MADAARAALDAAAALARSGNCQRARELCAAVAFEAQPLIATRADLLRSMVYALLAARGFRLLSRVALAVSGRTVQVILLPECGGPIAPPYQMEQSGRTIYALDPRWLDRLSPDDIFLRRWCDALIPRRQSPATAPGVAPASRHLEPA